MKAYKLEVLIVDHDELGKENMLIEFEAARFANDCIYPRVISVKEADIGEWTDDHLLNKLDTTKEQIDNYFI